MVVGIVGLGLIGASFAKTVKKNTDFAVLGYDASDEVVSCALLELLVDGKNKRVASWTAVEQKAKK